MYSRLSYSGHAKALLALGIPLMGSNVAVHLIGLTDTVMLGWYGIEELAAVTLAGSYFFVLFLLGSGFAWAVAPLVAAAHAAGDEPTLRRVTRMGLWLSASYALLSIPVLWYSEKILVLLGQDPLIAALAQDYLRITAPGMVPALMTMVIKSYLSGLARTRVVFWITVIAVLVNAASNYGLIFGNWGLPELGLRGAAITSIITHTVTFAGVLAYALQEFPDHLPLGRLWRADWGIFRRVARLGLPIGLTVLAEITFFTAATLMVGWLGTIPLAAHGIALQLCSAAFMLHTGLANAATVRAGNGLGMRDRDFVARGALMAIAISLAISAISIAILLGIPVPLLSAFLDSDAQQRDSIIALGVGLLAVAALFQTVDGLQVVAAGLLRGLQDTAVPMAIATLSYWGIGMPSSYFFGIRLDWGAAGVWAGFVAGLSAAALMLLMRFWMRAIHRMEMPPPKGVSEDCRKNA